jgi:hypothetical protein
VNPEACAHGSEPEPVFSCDGDAAGARKRGAAPDVGKLDPYGFLALLGRVVQGKAAKVSLTKGMA